MFYILVINCVGACVGLVVHIFHLFFVRIKCWQSNIYASNGKHWWFHPFCMEHVYVYTCQRLLLWGTGNMHAHHSFVLEYMINGCTMAWNCAAVVLLRRILFLMCFWIDVEGWRPQGNWFLLLCVRILLAFFCLAQITIGLCRALVVNWLWAFDFEILFCGVSLLWPVEDLFPA